MKVTLLLSFSICLMAFSSFAQKKDLKLAQSHYANKEYDKAETLINSVVSSEKGKADKTAWVIRGKVYAELASTKSDLSSAKTALESYTEAESLGTSGECKSELLNLAQICMTVGYTKESNEYFVNSIEWYLVGEQCMAKASPSDAQFNSRLAHCYFMTGKYDKAIKQHKRCIENGYQAADSYLGIDYCYGMSYDYTSAQRVSNVEDALKAFPENERILSLAMEVYSDANQFDEVDEINNKMVQLYPESPNTYFAYANAMSDAFRSLNERGEKDKAQAYFEKSEKSYLKADEILPNNASIQYSIGSLYYTKALQYQLEANELGFSKEEMKKQDELMGQSKELLKKALPYLETAYFKGSNDDQVLKSSLQTIYLTLDMSEEYKTLMGK